MTIKNKYNFGEIGFKLIDIAKEVLSSDFRDEVLQRGGKQDIVSLADQEIEERAFNYVKSIRFPANFHGEEKRQRKLVDNPKYLICFDPQDGTNNSVDEALHYCTIPTIFDTPEPRNLGSAVWTGIYDHVSREMAYFDNNKVYFSRDGKPIQPKTRNVKSLDDIPDNSYIDLILDIGPKETPEKLKPFSEILSKSWRKNVSCAGYHMLLIAMGKRDAYICPVQKPEELVAGIPLIEGVGGKVITFDGRRAKDLPYDFDSRYQIIATRVPELADDLRKRIKY